MATPAIVFDGVWKKFRRGERHDSLRDLIPAAARRLTGRGLKQTDLAADEFWVLRDVSFEVRPGEALGIIGQNGAGKSTALKLLTRLLKPTRGTASVHGRVGALIEIAAGFHPDLTGRENVYLQGAIMGMRRQEIERHFDAIVTFSGLEEFIDTPVKRYSSGMNARLGFSIAAHLEPEVLLIDEVLAVGDFTFQQKCYKRLREFRRAGTAIAFVSHNMQAVASLCDKAVMLRHGREPMFGPVDEVVTAYMSSGVGSSDPAVSITASRLFAVEGSNGAVSPGTRLVLEFELLSSKDLPRCGLGLQVRRADGLVMFGGASNIAGVDWDVQAGIAMRCKIEFTANVLRGSYSVGVFLLDTSRIWGPIDLLGVATFVVAETTRVEGCVELFPNFQMAASDAKFAVEIEEPRTGKA